MSHSDNRQGSSAGGLIGQSMDQLSTAANGDLHLLVTFETLAADGRTDGGDVPDVEVPVSESDREHGGDSASTGDGDESPGANESTDSGALADSEPFVDSVLCPDTSSGENADTTFEEAVDVESLVSYLGLDFVEHQLFADRFRLDADVVYTSRGVGEYQLLCVYFAGRGLLLVVDDDEAISPLVGQARSLLTEA